MSQRPLDHGYERQGLLSDPNFLSKFLWVDYLQCFDERIPALIPMPLNFLEVVMPDRRFAGRRRAVGVPSVPQFLRTPPVAKIIGQVNLVCTSSP